MILYGINTTGMTHLKVITRYSSNSSRIKAGDRTIRYEIRKLINSIWNKEKFPGEWKMSIIVRI